MLLTEADASKAYAVACDAIQDRVRRKVGPKCVLFFSAYKLDRYKLPVDNLDDVPVPGKVRIRRILSRRSQMGKDSESQTLESPSWLDLCVLANAEIVAARDRQRRFLERIEVIEMIGEVPVAIFHLES